MPKLANSAGEEQGVTRTLAVVLSIFMFCVYATDAPCASGKKRDRSSVLEVPTTGKIMDVVYQPEFDEWWVKCREGDNICVYSYDARAREWGKVLFVPKSPDEKTGVGNKTSSGGESGKEKATTLQDKIEEPKAGHGKDSPKAGGKTDAKWWDPFKILKHGEKIIRHPFTDSGR